MSLWYRLLNNNSIFNNRGVKLLSGKGPHAAHLTSIIIGKGRAEGQGGRGRGWGYFGHTSKVTWRPELDPPPSGLDLARVPYVWHPCSITTSFIFVFCSTMRQSAFNKKEFHVPINSKDFSFDSANQSQEESNISLFALLSLCPAHFYRSTPANEALARVTLPLLGCHINRRKCITWFLGATVIKAQMTVNEAANAPKDHIKSISIDQEINMCSSLITWWDCSSQNFTLTEFHTAYCRFQTTQWWTKQWLIMLTPNICFHVGEIPRCAKLHPSSQHREAGMSF